MNDLKRKTILLMDDDDDFRFLMRICAEAQGMEMLEASNCCDGLEIFKRERTRIDAVLVDYFMPGKEPRQCINALKGLTPASIPIVLVTAAPDAKVRAEDLGLERWISKPFNVHALRDLVFASDSVAPELSFPSDPLKHGVEG